MGIRTKGWLIITGVGLVFAAIGWFAYQQGSVKGVIGVVGSVLLGGGVGLQMWLRQRRFERNASSGFVLIRDAAVFEMDENAKLVQVALALEFDSLGIGGGQRIYRIFRMPAVEQSRYVPGARLPVRVMPNDLSIIHLSVPAEEAVGGRARAVEARVSQTPLTTYA